MRTRLDDAQARLLRAIMNMAAFHRDHQKFYARPARAGGDERLLALADRWSAVRPAQPEPFSPFESAEDLIDVTAPQLYGVLGMEGRTNQPEVIGDDPDKPELPSIEQADA